MHVSRKQQQCDCMSRIPRNVLQFSLHVRFDERGCVIFALLQATPIRSCSRQVFHLYFFVVYIAIYPLSNMPKRKSDNKD